jgi:hypothetical protein
MRISFLLALLLGALPATIRAQCTPATAVQTALDQLPNQSADETEWEFRQKHDAAIQALLARFPSDLFVQRSYVESMYRHADQDKVIAEYKARHEKNPDDPVLTYLLGTALMGRQSPESTKLFESALAKSPKFPWPHTGLASIYSMPVFLNKEEGIKQAQAFVAACPDSLDGYGQLTGVDDKKVLASYAEKLRALLQARTNDDALMAYSTLWSLEFKAHPASEYEGVRKQVADDLKRLRALNLDTRRMWYYTLGKGYKLANDQKDADWASDEQLRRLPRHWELASMSKWSKDHPRPNTDEAAAKKRAYYADLLKQTDAWMKERPKMVEVWRSRLSATEYLDDTPAADVVATAGAYLKLALAEAGPDGPDSYDYMTIARVLSRKHLQPERVVEMAQKALAKAKVDAEEPMYDGYATKDNVLEYKFYNALNPINPSGYEADGYIELKQAGKARLALTRMEDELQTVKAAVGDKAEFKKAYTTRLAFWWSLMARVAELEGHDQDAMGFYEHALLSRLEAQETPETGIHDEVADGARRLWTKLGGSNEGWQLWYGRQADVLSTQATLTWEDANQPLPAFEIADLKGKTWNLASLKGKTTFLNFWASW